MRLKSTTLAALVALLLTGCGAGGQATSAPTPLVTAAEMSATLEPALPLDADGRQLVARVNAEGIPLERFEQAVSRNLRQSDIASYDMVALSALDSLIRQVVVNQTAAQMGIVVTDDQLEAAYQEHRAELPDAAQWENWLEQNQFTDAQFRESLRENLIVQQVQAQVIDLEAAAVPLAHARHILVTSDALAQSVIERLQAGEDFAALAAELSLDQTNYATGGDLGWFAPNELTFTPELARQIFSAQPGLLPAPIQTLLGYHVVEVLEFGQRPAVDAELVELAMTQYAAWLDNQLAQATIERYIID